MEEFSTNDPRPSFVAPLSSEPPTGQLAPRSSRKRWPWVIFAVVLIFLVMTVPFLYASVSAVQHVRNAKQGLTLAYGAMASRQFLGAQTSLTFVQAELSAARDVWRRAGPLAALPWVQVQVKAFDQALEAGLVGIDAAHELLHAMMRIQEAFIAAARVPSLDPGLAPDRAFQDLSRAEKRSVLARLDQALPEIRAAREKASIALEVWERIPQDRLLPPARRAMEPVTSALQAFRRRSDVAVDALGLFLPMVGYPEAKTYIFVLQNADEIRPTGGFMGTMGVVRLDSGEITDQLFQDVYAFDRVASSTRLGSPPEPLRRELGVSSWFLRDSNWSPDVPQSAARILSLFEQEGWVRQSVSSVQATVADGVIFLEPEVFTQLLRLTGPITVDGMTFTADRFFDELQYAVEVGFAKQGLPIEARKRIVSTLGQVLVQRLQALPMRQWLEVFDLGLQAFEQKDVMVVMRDPELQRAFDARLWSGRARAASQDELWVVDANLAALKTDGVMDKRIDYQLDMTHSDGPRATVRLTYTNTNRVINWRYTRYRDYVRVYVPEGSQLISSEGAMVKDLNQSGGRFLSGQVEVSQELGKTVFGAFWSIEPGATRSLTFTYRLPERVYVPLTKERAYQLLVQKQPGAKQRLTLDLRLGKKVVSATPAEMSTEFGDDRYRVTTEVDRDRVFEVKVE